MTDSAVPAGRRLLLLRHAEAESMRLEDDHARRLTNRGVHAAMAIGRWLGEHDMVCDVVLCSTAERTRATWLAVHRGGAIAVSVSHHPELYSAGTRGVLRLLAELPDRHSDAATILIVGHAPTMPALAEALADGAGDESALAASSGGFPPAALAVLRLHPQAQWSELDRGVGELEAFVIGRP